MALPWQCLAPVPGNPAGLTKDIHMLELATESVPPGIAALLEDNPVVGEPRSGLRRFWTLEEDAILLEHYPKTGVPGCLPLLPGRTASSIYGRAGLKKLSAPVEASRRRAGKARQLWPRSSDLDDIIKLRYPECTRRRDVFLLAQSLNRPRWWVSKRATALGVKTPRFKEPDWLPEEIAFILTRGHLDPDALRAAMGKRGWKRTATAIVVKLKRVGATREDPDYYTANGLSRLFGVDSSTVSGWCERGLLKATHRGTSRLPQQGGDHWWIHRNDVRSFIIEQAPIIDIRKVDKIWFILTLASVPKDCGS